MAAILQRDGRASLRFPARPLSMIQFTGAGYVYKPLLAPKRHPRTKTTPQAPD